jgi:hypothetical protein
VHNIVHNYIRLHVYGWPNFFTHPHRSKELLGFTEEAVKSVGKAGYEDAVVGRTNS